MLGEKLPSVGDMPILTFHAPLRRTFAQNAGGNEIDVWYGNAITMLRAGELSSIADLVAGMLCLHKASQTCCQQDPTGPSGSCRSLTDL